MTEESTNDTQTQDTVFDGVDMSDPQAVRDAIKQARDFAELAYQENERLKNERHADSVKVYLQEKVANGVMASKVRAARPLLMDAAFGSEEITVDLSADDEPAAEETVTRSDLIKRILDLSEGDVSYGEDGRVDLTTKKPEDASDDAFYAKYQAAIGNQQSEGVN